MSHGESAGEQAGRKLSTAERLRAEAQLLTERADREERSAARWQRGSEGEQTVGAQLDLLRPHGFDVFHDVRWPGRQRANIDHVAVGPPGILVVDAKNWSGKVAIRDGVLRQNGFRREREVAGAKQAAQDVGTQLPWALHVIPVIALADSDAGGVDQCQGVTVLGHRDLVGWATSLPPRLTPGDVLGIASHLRGAMPPASVPAPRRTRTTPSRRAPRGPSARERQRAAKRAATRREAVTTLVVLAVLVVLGPTLFAWWASHGTAVVSAVIPTPTFPAAAPTPIAAAPVFADCAGLRAAYPYGVKLAGATNTGKKPRGVLVVDDPVYRANASLDKDQDGLACELTRSEKAHRG